MKIMLNDNQINKLKLLNEQVDDEFRVDVKVNVEAHGVKYKGSEIEDIINPSLKVFFNIEMVYRSYGLVDAFPHNLRGEDSLEIEIEYYAKDNDSYTTEELITVPLKWGDERFIIMTKNDTLTWVGIDNEATLTLVNDEIGNILAKSLEFSYFSI